MSTSDFLVFKKALEKAGACMDSHYFQLPVYGREQPMVRERVYCYELYHQLRNALPSNFPCKLHGEVDKLGHSLFRSALEGAKPDFIVHVPGRIQHNLV